MKAVADGSSKAAATRVVAVLAFEGVELLDAVGPLEAFATASALLGGATAGYRIELLGRRSGAIRAASSLTILTTQGIRTASPLDTLLVAGGAGVEAAATLAWVRTAAARQMEYNWRPRSQFRSGARVGVSDRAATATEAQDRHRREDGAMIIKGSNSKAAAARTEQDPRWRAVVARDRAADGAFFYSLRSTGVYCRPSCPARLAKPENVGIHPTRDDAERAGFRPCQRCKPDRDRRSEQAAAVRFAVGACSLGAILVARSEQGVCAILLGQDAAALVRDLQDRFPQARRIGDDAGLEELVAKVVSFVEAPRSGLDLPLDMRGTEFQQRVWQALREIPAGATASYADIAHRLGSPRSVRAVAQACAANALAVAVPCHRVVRSDGGLSGYRWGVERKRALLQREAAA